MSATLKDEGVEGVVQGMGVSGHTKINSSRTSCMTDGRGPQVAGRGGRGAGV